MNHLNEVWEVKLNPRMNRISPEQMQYKIFQVQDSCKSVMYQYKTSSTYTFRMGIVLKNDDCQKANVFVFLFWIRERFGLKAKLSDAKHIKDILRECWDPDEIPSFSPKWLNN